MFLLVAQHPAHYVRDLVFTCVVVIGTRQPSLNYLRVHRPRSCPLSKGFYAPNYGFQTDILCSQWSHKLRGF